MGYEARPETAILVNEQELVCTASLFSKDYTLMWLLETRNRSLIFHKIIMDQALWTETFYMAYILCCWSLSAKQL